MTNEEKFRAGTVVYKDDDGDYVCELWEASTHHPDVVYHMNADGKYKKSGLYDDDKYEVFQWLLSIAGDLTIVLFNMLCGNGIRLTIKRGLRSSFFVALGGATAGPGIFLPADNDRADYGRGGLGFQIFPFMAIFSTNSNVYQSIRSFPKLTLYGSQSYVKRGRPVMSPHMRRRGLGSS